MENKVLLLLFYLQWIKLKLEKCIEQTNLLIVKKQSQTQQWNWMMIDRHRSLAPFCWFSRCKIYIMEFNRIKLSYYLRENKFRLRMKIYVTLEKIKIRHVFLTFISFKKNEKYYVKLNTTKMWLYLSQNITILQVLSQYCIGHQLFLRFQWYYNSTLNF